MTTPADTLRRDSATGNVSRQGETMNEHVEAYLNELGGDFAACFTAMADEVHENSRAKGWWEEDRNNGEMIALMHSELSEALEGFRHGNPPDDHIPEFSSVEAELADVVIRIMDMAIARQLRVAEAIVAKHKYNTTREHKHGGKAF